MTLIFTRRRSLLAWLIRAFTKSPVSHVLIGGLKFYGKDVVLHSTHGGLRVDVFEVWQERTGSELVEVWKVLPDLSHNIPLIVERLGSKYDFANLVGNALSLFLRRFGISLRNLFADPNSFVCSELVVHLDPGGMQIPELRHLDAERTSAEDLRQLCRRSPAFKRIL